MQTLETSLEEGALQPRGKSRLILQQEGGRVVPVALVALLRTDPFLSELQRRQFWHLQPFSVEHSFFDHSGANSGVGDRIDQNETASCPIAGIRIKEKRDVSFKFDRSNIVHVQLRCLFLFERIDVHTMANL